MPPLFEKGSSFSSTEDYFFPAPGGKPMTIGNVYKNFRKFLWQAGISHNGRGHGPRVHDFRHTYAVHCLKKWVEQEKDLAAYLPILKTYLGHDSFEETAYYLRLTADVFPGDYLEIGNLLSGNYSRCWKVMLMKPTDFAKHLTEFLSVYLPAQKNVSKNTVYSYRDTFKLLIKYCQETHNIPAERIT
jgi:site-specific recombinase XerD